MYAKGRKDEYQLLGNAKMLPKLTWRGGAVQGTKLIRKNIIQTKFHYVDPID